MSAGWEKYEPSPIEFFHGELQKEFHKHRVKYTDAYSVELDGLDFNRIVVAAKKTTYKKYKALDLQEPVLKTDLIQKPIK